MTDFRTFILHGTVKTPITIPYSWIVCTSYIVFVKDDHYVILRTVSKPKGRADNQRYNLYLPSHMLMSVLLGPVYWPIPATTKVHWHIIQTPIAQLYDVK